MSPAVRVSAVSLPAEMARDGSTKRARSWGHMGSAAHAPIGRRPDIAAMEPGSACDVVNEDGRR